MFVVDECESTLRQRWEDIASLDAEVEQLQARQRFLEEHVVRVRQELSSANERVNTAEATLQKRKFIEARALDRLKSALTRASSGLPQLGINW